MLCCQAIPSALSHYIPLKHQETPDATALYPRRPKLSTQFEISHSTPFYNSNVMLSRQNQHSEGTTFLKPSRNTNPVTEHHIPQGMNPQQQCCGNL